MYVKAVLLNGPNLTWRKVETVLDSMVCTSSDSTVRYNYIILITHVSWIRFTWKIFKAWTAFIRTFIHLFAFLRQLKGVCPPVSHWKSFWYVIFRNMKKFPLSSTVKLNMWNWESRVLYMHKTQLHITKTCNNVNLTAVGIVFLI